MRKMIVILVGILVFTNTILAQKKKEQEKTIEHLIVVTATKTEQSQAEVSSSVTVITLEELQSVRKGMVLDVLRYSTGLDVIQSGGVGAVANISIRGSGVEHTLVLMDGVEMNDPMSPGRSFNFAHLSVDNIEQIEVVRGPLSMLYGSDAMGGIINIITRKGVGKPKFFLSGDGGSYNTFRGAAGVSGGTDLINYSLSASRFNTKGFSMSHEKYGNLERDGYRNTSFSARFGLSLKRNIEIDFIGRYSNGKTDLDLKGGEGGDDPNYASDEKQLFLRIQANLRLIGGKWDQKLGFSYSHNDRNYQNNEDPFHPSDLENSFYKGRMLKMDWQHNITLHKTNTLIAGIESRQEKGESEYAWESIWGMGKDVFPEKTTSMTGLYLQDVIKLKQSIFITLGVRFDNHSLFDSATTYRVSTAYLFTTGTKVKATYGTGFRAPSLYQLYAPATAWGSIGNEDLSPEKSTGWDTGIEQYLFKDCLKMGVTYFHNDFKDMIEFDWLQGYVNTARAKTNGVEIFASVLPWTNLTIRGNYTYTKTEDKKTGEQLLRRPKHKGNLSLDYCFLEKGNAHVGIIYVGDRDGIFPYPLRIKLDSYTLINLAVSYDITQNFQFFLRMDNLSDRIFEEIKGYGTARRSLYGGLRLTL